MLTSEPFFTAAARRHAARLAEAITPSIARLERDCGKLLKRCGYQPELRRRFLAIAPAGLVKQGALEGFLEEVEYQGRRLAKHNISPAEVRQVLGEMEALLGAVLGEQFGPSREQLHLATVLALNRAFYQVREAEAQALFGIYRAEAEADNSDDLLRRLVEVLTRAFRAGAGRMLMGAALNSRLSKPQFIERGSTGERLIVDPSLRGRFASYWSYPLDEGVVLQLGFGACYPWLPREKALLEIAAERCATALNRQRLLAEMRRLEFAARHAEEQERQRIGRELHDETAQSLAALRLQLEMMEREAEGPAGKRLRATRRQVERMMVELRRLIAALGPGVLERLGLAAALRQLVARSRKTHPAQIRVRIVGQLEGVPGPIQDVLYRVAQECLQNCSKHSQATTVNLSLNVADESVGLRVFDNGTGIPADAALRSPMSFGLAGMRERAALFGGTVTVRARAGKGTTIILELPLKR
jgi:signal transduction histidine kinase